MITFSLLLGRAPRQRCLVSARSRTAACERISGKLLLRRRPDARRRTLSSFGVHARTGSEAVVLDHWRYMTAAAVAVAATAAVLETTSSSSDSVEVQKKVGNGNMCCNPSESSLNDSHTILATSSTTILATSSTDPTKPLRPEDLFLQGKNAKRRRRTTAPTPAVSAETPILLDCDFVIVGHGNAGRAAVQQIHRQCPKATLAVIDPSVATLLRSPNYQKSPQIRYVAASAIALDHAQQMVLVNGNGAGIRYRHSVLIATGSRGSPPPQALVHPNAVGRILELRSTEVLYDWDRLEPQGPPAADTHDSKKESNGPTPPAPPPSQGRRPVLPKEGVRQLSLLAASEGASICVVGSGLEAVELAASIAQAHQTSRTNRMTLPKKTRKTKKQRELAVHQKTVDNKANAVLTPSKSAQQSAAKTVLMFGNAGPLTDRIPRYMSRAVAARLQNSGVDVRNRSLVRYVLLTNTKTPQQDSQSSLEIHAARSYDHLDTTRISTDLIVVAPSVEGQKGTAVVPTVRKEPTWNDAGVESTTVSYRPWSELTHPLSDPVLTCYSDDGRIMVNAELNAASCVYAAGSVAKYPDNLTGHATVAGEGIVTGSEAGVVAAVNMIREYAKAQSGRHNWSSATTIPSAKILTTNSLPVWRTDLVHSKPPHQLRGRLDSTTSTPQKASLKSLGIHALAVGECDSETLAIHGYWWTNKSSTRRDAENNGLQRKGTVPTASRPVFGSGFLYYLDRAGCLRGVLIWGLPFTTQKKEDGEEVLNEALVERMRDIIRSNGNVSLPQRVEMSGDFHDDNGLLTSRHLSEESVKMAILALRDAPPSFGKDFVPTVTQRSLRDTNSAAAQPLHLYTPAKPPSTTNTGILRRRIETGNGSMGEDLFTRSGEGDTRPDFDEDSRPVTLIYVSPMDYVPASPIVAVAPHGGDQTAKELRGRPPKEEILWLREGDKNRYTSAGEAKGAFFLSNLRQGRFANGEDAVQQAPVSERLVRTRVRGFFSTAQNAESKQENQNH